VFTSSGGGSRPPNTPPRRRAIEAYTSPAITDLGSLHELTLETNKIGRNADIYSGIVPIVGDLTEIS
jgi:hypothetical protein